MNESKLSGKPNCTGNVTSKVVEAISLSLDVTADSSSLDTQSTPEQMETVADAIERVLRRILLPIVVTIGMLGITMTVLVLTRKKTFTSTNSYFTALAVSDLIFLVLVATYLLDEPIYKHYGLLAINKFRVYMAYVAPIMDAMCMSSVWLTVTLTLERYIAICHPLHSILTCGVAGSRTIIVIIVLVCVLLRIPNFFESQVVEFFDTSLNTTSVYLVNTDLAHNYHYLVIYVVTIDVIVMAFVPFVLLFVFNLLIVVEVRRSTRYLKQRLHAGSSHRRILSSDQFQLTLILTGIVVVFFVCQAPYIVYQTVAQIARVSGSISMTLHYAREVTLVMLCLKSALNYALYCWFSEKFRLTFKHLFCMLRCVPRSSSNQTGEHNPLAVLTTRETTC